MGSTEVVEPLPNNENESFKESNSISNEYGCSNMKRKCYRKGSRICYTDLENITMLKKIPEKDISQISITGQLENQIYDKVDSYRSGESLFKTFTFEQTRDINDPETLKCIEFWKGVMQKNLAPIKCTLIESDKKKQSKRTDEKKKKSVSEAKRESIAEKPNEAEEKTNFAADQEKIWTKALKEIRDRKLDKLKLYVKERCEYCRDPFTKSFADELQDEKIEQAAEIEALNEWEPKQRKKSQSRVFSIKRLHSKIRRFSSTQTTESKEKADKSTEKEPSTIHLKARSSIYGASKQSDAKLAASAKHLGRHISPRSSINIAEYKDLLVDDFTNTGNVTKITEVQVPDINCPCNSSTCICTYKADEISKTNLIEEARKSMLEDKSNENIPTTYDDTCTCKIQAEPWETVTCSTEPCVGKQPKIQESSSDFDLNKYLEKLEKPIPCICGKLSDVVCSSEQCKNKKSQDTICGDGTISFHQARSMMEGDTCICPDEEAPCKNETCSTKQPQKPIGKCVCRNAKPWCEVKCQSWSCSVNHEKIRKQQNKSDVEEEINLNKFPPVKPIRSTCSCEKSFPWKNVQCTYDLCAGKHKPVSILQTEEKKRRSSVNIRKTPYQLIASSMKTSNTSQDRNNCICSTSEPWRPITCLTYCDTKEQLDKKEQKGPPLIVNKIIIPEDTTCICDDKTLEPICKAHKCQKRNSDVEYPPPCICPKDLDEGKQEHFRCDSEKCKMKKIDKTCICKTSPEAPCENKTCETKPTPSKTLKPANKRLNYDTRCVCKVRGVPTTEEVNCTAPYCPFRKRSLPKKKQPTVAKTIPYEDSYAQNITNKSKCLCKTGDEETICKNIKCRSKKEKRNSSITEENGEDEEPQSCICNDYNDSDHEVICRQVQCRKVSVTEGGVVMNDKCVCTSMEATCNEAFCSKLVDEKTFEKIIEESVIEERPYCYICGHYDCASTKNRTADEVCRK